MRRERTNDEPPWCDWEAVSNANQVEGVLSCCVMLKASELALEAVNRPLSNGRRPAGGVANGAVSTSEMRHELGVSSTMKVLMLMLCIVNHVPSMPAVTTAARDGATGFRAGRSPMTSSLPYR